jgi:hypothetical protein
MSATDYIPLPVDYDDDASPDQAFTLSHRQWLDCTYALQDHYLYALSHAKFVASGSLTAVTLTLNGARADRVAKWIAEQ